MPVAPLVYVAFMIMLVLLILGLAALVGGMKTTYESLEKSLPSPSVDAGGESGSTPPEVPRSDSRPEIRRGGAVMQ